MTFSRTTSALAALGLSALLANAAWAQSTTPMTDGEVKVGDKVKFRAEMPNGTLTVTAIALAK